MVLCKGVQQIMASIKSDDIRTRESPVERLIKAHNSSSKKTAVQSSRSYSKGFRCRYCKKAYSYAASVEKHENVCHAIQKTPKSICSVCGVSFASPGSATNHLLFQHTTNGSFVCFLCNEKFPDYASLLWHFDTHLPDEIIKCTKCHKVFPNHHTLQVHCCVNLGGDPLTCNSCHVQFSDVVMFVTEHPCIIVSGVMQCPCCLYMDKSEKIFTEHLSRHVGKGIHRCDVCSRQCRTEHSLKVHRERHWAKDEEKIPCKLCGKKFLNDRDVVRHGIAMHGIKKYKCNECPQAYTRETFLRHHINREHVRKQCIFNEKVGQAPPSPYSKKAKTANSISADDNTMQEKCMDHDERCILPEKPQSLVCLELKESGLNSSLKVPLEAEGGEKEREWQDDRYDSASCTTSAVAETIPHPQRLTQGVTTDNSTERPDGVNDHGLVLTEVGCNSYQDSDHTQLVASSVVPDELASVDQGEAMLNPVIPLHDLKNLSLFKEIVTTESTRVQPEEFTILKQAISTWEEKSNLCRQGNGKRHESREDTRKDSSSESDSNIDKTSEEVRSTAPEEPENANGESQKSLAIAELEVPANLSVSRSPCASLSDKRENQRGEAYRKAFYGALPIFCHYQGDDSSSEEEVAEDVTPDETVTPSLCADPEKEQSRSLTPDSAPVSDTADEKDGEGYEELSSSPLDAFLASVRAQGGSSDGGLPCEGNVKKILPEQGLNLDDIVLQPIDVSVENDAMTSTVVNDLPIDPLALQCFLCKSMFSTLTQLKRHESQDHPLKCEVCNRAFTSNARLENHVCLSRKKPAWTCQYCAETFPSSSMLGDHKKNHHGRHKVSCIKSSDHVRENSGGESLLPSEDSRDEESQFSALVFPRATKGLVQASAPETEDPFSADSRVITTSLSMDSLSKSQPGSQCVQSTTDLQSPISSTDALEEMDHTTGDGRRIVILEEPLIPKVSMVNVTEEKRSDVLQLTVMLDIKSCLASTMDVSYLQTSDGASGLFIPLDCVKGIEMTTPNRPAFAPNEATTIDSVAFNPEPPPFNMDGDIEFILDADPAVGAGVEKDEFRGDSIGRKEESTDFLAIIEEVELQV